MDSEPASAQAPAHTSTEPVPNPAPLTTPAPEPRAAANEEDVSTTDVPHAENAPKNPDDSTDGSDSEDEIIFKVPSFFADTLFTPVDRDRIIDYISRKTPIPKTSVDALESFLDVAHAIDLTLRTIAYKAPPPSGRQPGRKIAKPEIRRMNWEEWTEARRERDVSYKEHSAMTILIGEPQVSLQQWPLPLLRGSSGFRRDDTTATESRQHPNNREQSPLPARIRINSVPIMRLLGSIFDVQFHPHRLVSLVYGRPFKVLAIHSKEINAKLAEIERIHSEKLNELETSKTAAEEMLTAGKDIDGPTREDEAHPQGDDGADSNAEDATKNNILKAEAHPPARSQSPDIMQNFTGANWDEFDLSEIKEFLNDFSCLVSFVNDTLQPVRSYLQTEPESVNFHNIWHLFPTGSLVYAKDKSTPQKIWKVIQANGGRRYMRPPGEAVRDWDISYSPFVIECYYLDFDGTNFIRVCRQFSIETFEDLMPIDALQIMPLAVAERLLSGIDRAEFRKRGEQFLTYRTPQYRYYHGTTLTESPNGDLLFRETEDHSHRIFTEQVESQVVVDFERGIQANPAWGPRSTEPDLWKSDLAEYEAPDNRADDAEKDNVWDSRVSEDFLKTEEVKRQRWNKDDGLPEGDDLLLLPGRVFGYVLRTRTWACLRLSADDSGGEHLTRVDRRTDTWQDLEIPQGHKLIVQALINTHFSKNKTKDPGFDLVREKGKGVIVLLHGVPGVGKTATAECVAVSHGKPLLPITCGDLGLKPKEVEATLQTAFQLAQAWDCVMLLDEADIFLAQRTNQDIERNALVSVFLRILEYYEGILFLTTNRIGAFDEAFKSRIHMALYYPPLNWPTTEKIWRNLIRRTLESPMKVECSLEALVTFARQLYEEQDRNSDPTHWNGRQIRNAFQSAIALARNENLGSPTIVKVEPRHFSTVAEVSNEFNTYLWRVKSGRTDADIAKEVQSRYDDFTRATFTQGTSLSPPYQFPLPAQAQMPMRQVVPQYNSYQSFPMQQTVPQQPTYSTVTGPPYNPTQQQQVYTQPAPLYNLPHAYGAQQPQYPQHLQAQPGQQPQAASSSPGQQYQPAQAQAGYSQQPQMGTQTGYATGGAADPTTMPPQGFQPSNC